jgi:hypothetical protein
VLSRSSSAATAGESRQGVSCARDSAITAATCGEVLWRTSVAASAISSPQRPASWAGSAGARCLLSAAAPRDASRFDHARWLRVEHATTGRSRFPAWFHPRGLQDLPELANPVASDTAVVTAWWPDTLAERVTLALERHLNQEGAGPRYPELGQDIKVMAIRQRRGGGVHRAGAGS